MRQNDFYSQVLMWQNELVEKLIAWTGINSWSKNLLGLAEMRDVLLKEFTSLGTKADLVKLPDILEIEPSGNRRFLKTGDLLYFVKKAEKNTGKPPLKFYLGGHYDTVYPPNKQSSSFKIENGSLFAPGSADMKGGLLVLHTALRLFSTTAESKNTEWHIVLNPDEEIGSPGSTESIVNIAKKTDLALLFEPSMPDGSLVIKRKGSANFTLFIKGKSAHAGRDPKSGKNAISAAAKLILELEEAQRKISNLSLNIGLINGGHALNVVAPNCLLRLNIRFDTDLAYHKFTKLLNEAIDSVHENDLSVEVHLDVHRSPKPFSKGTAWLFEEAVLCGKTLGFELNGLKSGGVCDGNLTAKAGVATLDTLGVVGGNLHSPEEYTKIDSIAKRSALAALLMQQIARKHKKDG